MKDEYFTLAEAGSVKELRTLKKGADILFAGDDYLIFATGIFITEQGETVTSWDFPNFEIFGVGYTWVTACVYGETKKIKPSRNHGTFSICV